MKKRTLFKSLSLILSLILLLSAFGEPMSFFAEDKESPLFYGSVTLPEITENEYWDNTGADYDLKQNLLLGAKPQIMCGQEPTETEKQYDTKLPAAMLTDGEYSTSQNVHCGKFFEVYTSAYRAILFDLGKISAISTFKTSFLEKTSWGVHVPTNVEVKASLDGNLWYKIADISISTTDDAFSRDEYTLENAVGARFVCFSFSTPSAWAGCDELEVVGTKNAENAKELSTLGVKGYHFIQNKYPEKSQSLLGGVSDMLLAYHSKTFDWDEEHFNPYLAYVDKSGESVDMMFDGYLFLLSGTFPSGKRGYEASKMTDWTWELDKLFAENKNIDALNSAAGKAISKLGLENFKYKFFVTVYYPDYAQTDFGDIDGDGISENFNDVENRIKAEKWYIDEFYERYNATDYENIEFGGFYWYNESIGVTERNKTLLNGVADYIHDGGSQFFWIPYCNAGGFYCPEEFGFDYASMQPNLTFDKSTPFSKFDYSVALSKQYGLGVEYEAHNGVLTDKEYFDRYMYYLKNADVCGYDNSISMYYQDVLTFYNAYKSTNEMSRAVYDYTYRYIDGSFKAKPDSQSYSVFVGENSRLSDKLKVEDSSLVTYYTLCSQAENGTVTVNDDGTFTYVPNAGFYGEDSFGYTYNNLIDESEECVVTVHVNHVHCAVSADNAISPSCTKSGKETDIICSECGETLTKGKTLPALGHVDSNSDNKCDVCSTVIDQTKNCSCLCHQSGIMGFIYRIVRIFWRIFSVNQYCDCGVKHY